MKIRYDQSQDITLILEREEDEALLRGPTQDFFDMHLGSNGQDNTNKHYILLKGTSEELTSHFFLGHSTDIEDLFKDGSEMEGMGKIIIPEPGDRGAPWMINLSEEGIKHYRAGWQSGVRYNGSNKLFIQKRG